MINSTVSMAPPTLCQLTFQEIVMQSKYSLQNGRCRVFDWDEAARFIRDIRPRTAMQGLAEDWLHTRSHIYSALDGPIMGGQRKVRSTWATPVLVVIGKGMKEVIPCFKYQEAHTNCNEDWPKGAIDILRRIRA